MKRPLTDGAGKPPASNHPSGPDVFRPTDEIPSSRPPATLDQAVRRRQQRRARGAAENRRSIGQDIALMGVLGWTIVIPTLVGTLIGRWLDHHWGGPSGVFWTLGLLVAGLALGCRLAWNRMHRP